jgi:hypothetical protein
MWLCRILRLEVAVVVAEALVLVAVRVDFRQA